MRNSFPFFTTIRVSLLFLLMYVSNACVYGQCTFGNVNPGFPGPSNFGADYLLGVSYNCPTQMTITSLNLLGLGTNANVQMAIYADNGGVPGSLIASSAQGVVGNGVISLAIPPTQLTAGNYWIMAIYDNTGITNHHTNFTSSTSKTVYYTGIPFGSSHPANASGFTSYCCQDFEYWASGDVTGVDTRTECNSYTWIDGNTYTSSNNVATHNIPGGSSSGCDSIVTLDLTIINSTTGTDTRTECSSYTWIDGNTYTSSNNVATHTIPGGSSNGCDSIVTLDLTIVNATAGTDTRTECNSYTWIDGNTYTSSNNVATHTIPGGSSNGCDSIVTLDLTIVNATAGTDTRTECDSYTWIDGNTYTSSNNTATHNIPGGSSNGCDSIVTLDLTIYTVNTNTTLNGITISSDAIGASYQWLDCDNGMSIIAGETNPSYTAGANGNYAVAVTENGCTDTSACITIATVNILENSLTDAFVLYPNPTKGNFTIEFDKIQEKLTIRLLTSSGQVIENRYFENANLVPLEINQPNGMYFLEVHDGTERKMVIKLIKE